MDEREAYTQYLACRVDRLTADRVRRIARAGDRSVSYTVRALLCEALDARRARGVIE